MNIRDWPCWAKVGAGVMLAVFVLNWPSSSSEWAAWVQAFGSIGAILAAVYVLRKERQNRLDQEKEKAKSEERQLLLALKTELVTRKKQYMILMGDKIEKGKLRELGIFVWKTPDNPFYVYVANLPKLGIIGCDKTREKIVETYACMEGLLLTIHTLQEQLRVASKGGFVCFDSIVTEWYQGVEEYHYATWPLYEECLELINQKLTG